MNPVSTFEKHAGDILATLIGKACPFPEVKVSALFNSKMTKISDSKIEVELISGTPVGSAYLFINPLALIQDPKLVFELALPHEYAHVLTQLLAFRGSIDLPEHGDEWMEFLHQIDASEASLPLITSDALDFTATKILKGYVTFSCSCDRTFVAVSNSMRTISKYVSGEITCDFCQGKLERVSKGNYSPKLTSEIDYLTKLDEKRKT